MSKQRSPADRRCDSSLSRCPPATAAGQDAAQHASTRADATPAQTRRPGSTGLTRATCHSHGRFTGKATLMRSMPVEG
eukprot:6783092-Heterocapsa_arctica.AAC.1